MRIIHVILAGWILMTASDICCGKEWRGIIPLKSSRADVERLLGRQTGPLPTYYLSDSTVTFWYSNCRCGDKCQEDWNVPVDTVISIHVDLKGVFRLADLGLDLSQFKKSRLADDVPGSFIYSNAKEGFAIEGGVEYVSTLIYGPRAEDDHLRCRHNSSPLQTEAKEWRGIVPLHSTRTQVEQLLGPPTAACKCFYEGDEVNVQVVYSRGDCKTEQSAWNVPADTVIRFTVYFTKKKPLMSDLKIDWTKYKKTEEVEGWTCYVNKDEGLIISVYNNRVTEYQFVPMARDDTLRCPSVTTIRVGKRP